MQVEYYFDFSCPYAYLGSAQIEAVARRTGADLVWRPVLLGGIFKAVETPMEMNAGMGPAKARNNLRDMRRWADILSVPLVMPAGHPIRTVRALRTLLASPAEAWPALIHELYRCYWVSGRDIRQTETLGDALAVAGVTGEAAARALAAGDDPQIKDELRRRTQEAIERGVFGVPTMFVCDPGASSASESLMFWGQDRLHLVEAALSGWRPDSGEPGRVVAPPEPVAEGGSATIDFFYDFSSPYAYLGSTQIEDVAARAGAELRWRPMLLGAVFKEIGAPNVPLLSWSDAKRRYMGRDLHSWAAFHGVEFRFSSRFPMRSITALRLALQAGDRIAELSHAIFRAAWVDDVSIEDEASLRSLVASVGLDPEALLAGTREPAVKQRLIDNTTEAVRRGVFGAPTSIVARGGHELLFWGQDRLDMVERAARGWTPPDEIG